MTYQPSIRLFVSEPLAGGAAVTLTKDQSHYLVNVMRKPAGTPVLLFNGRDGEWLADILAADKKACVLAVQEQTREQSPEPDVWLLFAPLKKDRTDFLIEKATELGAARLQPVITARTQSQRVNVDRLRATALESAEQSHRLTVPEVMDPHPLAEILANWPDGRALVHLDENGTGRPLATVLKDQTGPLAFVTGPEGGFAADEVEAFRNASFAVAADLGPRILRAETAAAAALSIRQGVDDARKHATSS